MGSASETTERPQPRDNDTRGIRRILSAASQREEVVRSGLRTFAEAQPLANASYTHGRRVVDTDVPLLAAYCTQLGRGFLQMQQSYFDVLRRSMEVAKVQRDLYRNAVTTTIEASRTVLQAAAQVAQSAMQPLQGSR